MASQSAWLVETPELIERLAFLMLDFADTLAPLLDQLRAPAIAYPPDPVMPSHGCFDVDQVLIAERRVVFIDFDSCCLAEPALDAGHFRAAITDSGMKLIDEPVLRDPARCQSQLHRLDALGSPFLNQYKALASISWQRLALREALNYLRDALHVWKQPKLSGAEAVIRILEYHLRGLVLLA